MSKKQDRSSRKSDLPDWADEVTPADEVMEKFYAPTGLFRPGPIGITRESADLSPSVQVEHGKDTGAPTPPPDDEKAPVNTPHISAEESYPHEVAPGVNDAKEAPITPSPGAPIHSPERSSWTPQPKSETTQNREASAAADVPFSDPLNLTFSEFADRWKRYLYPGQLAVMRALYELTFLHGTSECFTRYSELAALTKMSRRNCINVVNSLVERGFIERLEIRNDATGKGIRLRVHLAPLQ